MLGNCNLRKFFFKILLHKSRNYIMAKPFEVV